MVQRVGRYELLKKIASGGMAEIHLAKLRGPQGFEKLVVLKSVLPHLVSEPGFVDMFLHEARVAAGLSHPNIVHIFELGEADGKYFLAMEHILGESLRAVLRACRVQGKELPLQHVVLIGIQACEALQHAHTQKNLEGRPLNLVHRDVSPQNILVTFDGVVKLVDFGIAKAVDRFITETTQETELKGKFGYMSPEQVRGEELDGRADLFSLGVVLWELCTGRRLFKRKGKIDTLRAIVAGQVVPARSLNPRVPPALDAVLQRALSADRKERFASALDMHQALTVQARQHKLDANAPLLGTFMRNLFPDDLANLQRITDAQARGVQLEAFLFDDLKFDHSDSDPSDGSGPSPAEELTQEEIRTLQLRVPPAPPLPPLTLQGGSPKTAPQAAAAPEDRLETEPTAEMGALPPPIPAPVPSAPPAPPASPAASAASAAPAAPAARQRRSRRIAVVVVSAAAVIVAGLLLAAGLWWRGSGTGGRPAVSEDVGSVEVITRPPRAQVELDGVRVPGLTPVILRQVEADREHTLRAKRAGRPDWVTTFRVGAGERIRLEGSFE